MTTYKILSRRVPPGGRHLTSAECRRLRAAGCSCSPRWRVEPRLLDFARGDGAGHLYYPSPSGGFSAAGVIAEVVE